MGTFVTQSSTPSIYTTKAPSGRTTSLPENQRVNATDMNGVQDALLDARSAVREAYQSVKHFGAKGDGATDDLAAFNAAIAAATANGRVFVPFGTYYLSGPLHINKAVTLEGPTRQRYGTANCILRFAAGVDGIIIETNYSGGSGANAHVKNLTITQAAKTGAAYGVRLTQKATIEGCYISTWKTNGIIIDSTYGVGANCNSFEVLSCAIDGCDGDGVRITGADSNAGVLFNVSSRSNGGWGFQDTSLTSSTYVQCHTEANTTGSYRIHNSGQGGRLVNCYAESDQPAPDIALPAVVDGGTWGVINTANVGPAASRADPTWGFVLGDGQFAGCLIETPVLWTPTATASLSKQYSLFVPFIGADTTVTATPAFTGATVTTGQLLTIHNNTIYTLVLQDESVLSGSGFMLKSGTLTLRAGEGARFLGSGGKLYEVARYVTRFTGNSTGTPGAATLNTPIGRSTIAAGASSIVITNNRCTTSSVVHAVLQASDATLTQVLRVVPGAGSFTIVGNANATANTAVGWSIVE